MPITVRYGDAGDIGRLATQAGEGEEFRQRFLDEQRMVESARRHQLAQERNRIDAQRLQQAAAQARQRGRVGSAGRPGRIPTGAPSTATTATPPTRTPGSRLLNAEESEAYRLSLQAGDKETAQSILRDALRRQQRPGKLEIDGKPAQLPAGPGEAVLTTPEGEQLRFETPQAPPDEQTLSKQRYLKSVAAQLPQPLLQSAQALAADPTVDADEFVERLQDTQKLIGAGQDGPGGATPTALLGAEVRSVREQADIAEDRMEYMRDTLKEAGIDPEASPAELQRQIDKLVDLRYGFGNAEEKRQMKAELNRKVEAYHRALADQRKLIKAEQDVIDRYRSGSPSARGSETENPTQQQFMDLMKRLAE